ncbi:MAG: HNH endonuclease family protein [Snowella sp.]
MERINNSPNRWARENAQRLKWDTENVIISLIEDEFKHFSHIYTLILKRSSRFDPVFDIIHYNYIADFSWQVTILLSSIRLDDDDNEVSRKMRILSKYIDFWLVSRFANGKRVQASDNQELFELTINIRNMDFDTLKDYLIKKVDSSELHILGGKKGKKGGIRELSLNNYTKKGIKYILARISEFIERSSTEEDTTWLSWFMHKADIEHIVEDNYERYTADYYSKDDFKSYRNKIGALILLESGKNKSLKDRPFSYKKNFYLRGLFARSLCEKAYIHETGFRNFITKNGFDFKPYEKFGIEEIDERTDLIAQIAEYIWNRDRIIEIE